MKYQIKNLTTGNIIGFIDKAEYPELKNMIMAKYNANTVVFDSSDPLPCTLMAHITGSYEEWYEKIEVSALEIDKEVRNLILTNLPFNLKDVTEAHNTDGIISVYTKDKKYLLKWHEYKNF